MNEEDRITVDGENFTLADVMHSFSRLRQLVQELEHLKTNLESREQNLLRWSKLPESLVTREEVESMLRHHLEQVAVLNRQYWDDYYARTVSELKERVLAERKVIDEELMTKASKGDVMRAMVETSQSMQDSLGTVEGDLRYTKSRVETALAKKAEKSELETFATAEMLGYVNERLVALERAVSSGKSHDVDATDPDLSPNNRSGEIPADDDEPVIPISTAERPTGHTGMRRRRRRDVVVFGKISEGEEIQQNAVPWSEGTAQDDPDTVAAAEEEQTKMLARDETGSKSAKRDATFVPEEKYEAEGVATEAAVEVARTEADLLAVESKVEDGHNEMAPDVQKNDERAEAVGEEAKAPKTEKEEAKAEEETKKTAGEEVREEKSKPSSADSETTVKSPAVSHAHAAESAAAAPEVPAEPIRTAPPDSDVNQTKNAIAAALKRKILLEAPKVSAVAKIVASPEPSPKHSLPPILEESPPSPAAKKSSHRPSGRSPRHVSSTAAIPEEKPSRPLLKLNVRNLPGVRKPDSIRETVLVPSHHVAPEEEVPARQWRPPGAASVRKDEASSTRPPEPRVLELNAEVANLRLDIDEAFKEVSDARREVFGRIYRGRTKR